MFSCRQWDAVNVLSTRVLVRCALGRSLQKHLGRCTGVQGGDGRHRGQLESHCVSSSKREGIAVMEYGNRYMAEQILQR